MFAAGCPATAIQARGDRARPFLLFDRINKRMIPTQERRSCSRKPKPLFWDAGPDQPDGRTSARGPQGADADSLRLRNCESAAATGRRAIQPRSTAASRFPLETQRLDDLLEYVRDRHRRRRLCHGAASASYAGLLPLAQARHGLRLPCDSPLAQLSFVSPTDLATCR